MKLLQIEAGNYVFHLPRWERGLLLSTIRHYPLVPEGYQRASRESPPPNDGDSQSMLDEALQDHRREARRQLDLLLANQHRFVPEQNGFRLSLDRSQIEWLLQVLNDVRVGAWIKVGCPDPDLGKAPEVKDEDRRFLAMMDLCSYFQCAMLNALEHQP